MTRIDDYSAKTLSIGSSASGTWGADRDWSKNISVSSGKNRKSWDLTDYADAMQSYSENWFLHIQHGSGSNSYCEFEGDSTGRPRLVIEYQQAASVPTLSAYSVNLGNTITIHTNRAQDNYTHNLYYSMGNIENELFASGIATECLWAPSTSLAQQMPNDTSGICTITCVTYDAAGVEIGRKSV